MSLNLIIREDPHGHTVSGDKDAFPIYPQTKLESNTITAPEMNPLWWNFWEETRLKYWGVVTRIWWDEIRRKDSFLNEVLIYSGWCVTPVVYMTWCLLSKCHSDKVPRCLHTTWLKTNCAHPNVVIFTFFLNMRTNVPTCSGIPSNILIPGESSELGRYHHGFYLCASGCWGTR